MSDFASAAKGEEFDLVLAVRQLSRHIPKRTLVMHNHGVVLLENWMNTSEIRPTAEKMGVVPLQPTDLTHVLKP